MAIPFKQLPSNPIIQQYGWDFISSQNDDWMNSNYNILILAIILISIGIFLAFTFIKSSNKNMKNNDQKSSIDQERKLYTESSKPEPVFGRELSELDKKKIKEISIFLGIGLLFTVMWVGFFLGRKNHMDLDRWMGRDSNLLIWAIFGLIVGYSIYAIKHININHFKFLSFLTIPSIFLIFGFFIDGRKDSSASMVSYIEGYSSTYLTWIIIGITVGALLYFGQKSKILSRSQDE